MNKAWWGRASAFSSRRGKIPTSFPPDTVLVQKPIERGIPLPKGDLPIISHGQYIYLYNNIRTSQVVYSLSRHLNNKDALDQLPYLGKKTVPPRLRKDLWTPFAMVYFPSPHAGLAAYRKLREFRRLHELEYPLSTITETEGKHAGKLYPTKKRGRILMDQKANSVADLAAVLLQQEQGPSEERVDSAERRIRRAESLKRMKGERNVKKDPVDVEEEMKGVDGVQVRWADLSNAEFAETWPEGVVHDTLQKSRHTVAWPAKEILDTEAAEPSAEAPQDGTDQDGIEEVESNEKGSVGNGNEEKKGWFSRILPQRAQSPAVATP